MALLNINVGILSYLDQLMNSNPKLKMQDLNFSQQGIPTGIPQQIPIELAPGQTLSFVNNSRTLSFTGSTSFSISLVAGTSNARLVGNFGARTARTYGDNTTQWVISRTNQTTRLTYGGTGTAPNFGTMQAGDNLTIEQNSIFNPLNWGDFIITNVGANYVEFQNPSGVGETQTATVAIYSNGPVQAGDYLDLSDSAFAYQNRGVFQIGRVTDTYVEFPNINATAQSAVTGVTGLNVYNQAYKWLAVLVDQRVIVRLNGDSGSTVEVEPIAPGDISGNPGIFLKRGRVYSVTIFNPSNVKTSGFIFITA